MPLGTRSHLGPTLPGRVPTPTRIILSPSPAAVFRASPGAEDAFVGAGSAIRETGPEFPEVAKSWPHGWSGVTRRRYRPNKNSSSKGTRFRRPRPVPPAIASSFRVARWRPGGSRPVWVSGDSNLRISTPRPFKHRNARFSEPGGRFDGILKPFSLATLSKHERMPPTCPREPAVRFSARLSCCPPPHPPPPPPLGGPPPRLFPPPPATPISPHTFAWGFAPNPKNRCPEPQRRTAPSVGKCLCSSTVDGDERIARTIAGNLCLAELRIARRFRVREVRRRVSLPKLD